MGVNASASLVTQIKAHSSSLTKAEQRVAAYIIENPESVIFQSVSDLADCSKTSDATVMRTCKRLGFSSYQEFKVLLAQAIASSDQVINGTITVEENAPAASITDSVFECTIQTLRLTQSALDISAIEAAVELLCLAETIFILGLGGSHAIALDLQHKLLRLGMHAVYQPDVHLQRITIVNQVTEKDVVFAISHSGSSRDIVDNTAMAKELNAKIISLTNFGKSPLSALSDVHLCTLSDETKHSLTSVTSRIAQLAVIDILHTLIASRDKDRSIEKISNVNRGMATLKY